VVGLLALGSRHGIQTSNCETIGWSGSDQRWRRARIPVIYFVKDSIHELA
jgi:hypothetical protein